MAIPAKDIDRWSIAQVPHPPLDQNTAGGDSPYYSTWMTRQGVSKSPARAQVISQCAWT